MKNVLKVTSVTKTELKLESGKNTFTMPANPDAIKKAKSAMRKGSNITITFTNGEITNWGTSSSKPNIHSKVPSELEKYWDQYVPPVNKEHANMLNFIHNDSISLKPEMLMMTPTKWKYLVRSVLRGKNIMMTGAAGGGKTMAAKAVANALDRQEFYFNLGATQDPRSTLIGNTHFKKDSGTCFSESLFVKAIQTPDAVILLDELSRAHPEAWNILMTVLDPGQRYLRLDEKEDSPTIKVAKGVSFIATSNIGNEYTSTRVMDRALMDRFVILEIDLLTQDNEEKLLTLLYPEADVQQLKNIAAIVTATRQELKSETARISTSISTRASIEFASLVFDGFSLEEAAEVVVYPQFDDAGGLDSERTFIKQLVQKYAPSTQNGDIFNTENEELFTQEDIESAS